MRCLEKTSGGTSLEALVVSITFCLAAVLFVAYGAGTWFPPNASRHGAGIDRMINYLLVTAGAMFFIGHFVLSYCVFRFTRQSKVTYRVASAKVERNWSLALGIIMALVAEGGVLVLGLPVWGEFYNRTPPADAVAIEVTGEQFAWNVRYPGRDGIFGRTDSQLIGLNNPLGLDEEDSNAGDDLLLTSEFFLPVNRPVNIRLRSKDVLHSFYLPHFRVKQDAVPGMNINVWFVPARLGDFELACTELCGFGHYKMRGLLHVVSDQEFEQFLEEEIPFLQ